jgi:predicted TPR repeat methyltransferase
MEQLHATADSRALIQRVSHLIQAGETGAARPLLAAVRQLNGPSAGLSHLAALLALRDGAVDEARADLDLAIAETPDHAGLRVCRAELRHRLGDLDGATRDAAEAVVLDRADPVAKALLGALLLELGRAADAVSCLTEALAQRPEDAAFRETLAKAWLYAGDADAALLILRAGIALTPAIVSLRNAAVMLCIRRRDFAQAVELALAARAVGIADACLFGLMGHALSSLGRHDDASQAYREALKLGPDDPYVRHLAAGSGAVVEGPRAPGDYVRAVFDGYADRFEAHLIGLGYRIPGVLRAIVQQHPALAGQGRLGKVLDLGCGTGLVGLILSDLPIGPLTGVDLSAAMLAQARGKGVYDRLIEADIETALADSAETWPLVTAADVLCYFGALERVLAALRHRLEPGGWFLFSLELLLAHHDGTVPGNGDWALQRQGRYAHAPAYVERAALDAGFVIRENRHEVIRFKAGLPVEGLVMVLERPRHDG